MVSPFDDKVMGNPIGWLQEMCMSRRCLPPSYDMEHEEGLPHERQFTMSCKVLKYNEVGTGKSKKLAKRMAAHKMWQSLQDMSLENPTTNQDEEEEVSYLYFHKIHASNHLICLNRLITLEIVQNYLSILKYYVIFTIFQP